MFERKNLTIRRENGVHEAAKFLFAQLDSTWTAPGQHRGVFLTVRVIRRL